MALRFQCTFCFTIIRHGSDDVGSVTCPSCNKRVAIPRSRFEAGCVIDDFVIDSLIAHGGMASVYLARQLSMDRMVALKILKSKYRDQQNFVDSFLKEAKSAARLNHPNIIQALAVGVESEALFYAMEYVKGETLAARIDREKNLDEEAALNVVQQCAEALHAAWTQEGLIHRDIKPENVMLADDGYAKIMDLGIAVSKYDAEKAEISGTPTYMAPEQFRRGKLDCRTDIYALGCTLYHAITGFPPFDGETVEEVAQQHLYNELTYPDQSLVPISQRLRKLISQMLAKDPQERFQDYDELLEEVVAIRRRLAPDDAMVPSVHTISFSKYRLREELAESPSEIYRKRTDKKRKVAQAKQQKKAAPAPVVATRQGNRAVPWLLALMALLLCIIGVLSFVVITRQRQQGNRTFAGRARAYITSHRQHVMPSYVDTQALEDEMAIGANLAADIPDKPTEDELAAFVELHGQLAQMSQRLALVQAQRARDAEAALADALGKIKRDRDALQQERDAFTAERAAFEEETQRFTDRETAALLQDSQRKGEEAELKRRLAEAEKLQADLVRPVLFQLQNSLIENVRAGRYTQAQALVAPVDGDPPSLAEWRERKAAELENALSIINAVGLSNQALTGQRLSEVRIISISDHLIRYSTADSPDTVRERHLRDLNSAQLMELAQALPEPPIMAEPVPLHLALCYGDFKLAFDLVKSPVDQAYVTSVVAGTYAVCITEIATLQLIAQRTLAKARILDVKQRYEGLPGFTQVEGELSDLMRGGGRTTTTDTQPAP